MRVITFLLTASVFLQPAAVFGQGGEYTVVRIGDAATQAVAINSSQEVLVQKCPFSQPCTAFLWSQKKNPITLPVVAQSFSGLQLNDKAEVAGVRRTAVGAALFVWSENAGIRDVPVTAGDLAVVGLNDRGEIAGNVTSGGRTRAFLATFDGAVEYLSTVSGPDTRATAINARGEVVGAAGMGCAAAPCAPGVVRAFLWSKKDGMRVLDTRADPSSGSVATDINDRGEVAGSLATGNGHAFLWTERTGMKDLGCPGAACQAVLLAGNGLLAGNYLPYSAHLRAFVWTEDGGMRDLGYLSRATAEVRATNRRGQLVGNSPQYYTPTHAFVWSETRGLVDLDPGNWPGVPGALFPMRSSFANAINDKGVIAGSLDGQATIWIPKPAAAL
jgi:probable HAF family extracellular repeat protein